MLYLYACSHYTVWILDILKVPKYFKKLLLYLFTLWNYLLIDFVVHWYIDGIHAISSMYSIGKFQA